MKTVIIAPHPDDEWIGCGCTLLKKLDDGEKVKVFLITSLSVRRTEVSRELARIYSYELKILGEPEWKIDTAKLAAFLKKEVHKKDTVYVPSPNIL